MEERKATTPEAREQEMIGLAVNLAEQQLRDGTASSQVISFYLKMGAERERLERDILRAQSELYQAKTKAINDTAMNNEMIQEAMRLFKVYSGHRDEVIDEKL